MTRARNGVALYRLVSVFKPPAPMHSIGQQVIDQIIKGGLAHATCAHDTEHGCVVVWSGGAPEQLDALIERRLKDQTRTIHEAQDMLTAAMERGDPTTLHMTAHAVRDNLRTVLAALGRQEPASR